MKVMRINLERRYNMDEYIKVEWPESQVFMAMPHYEDWVYYDVDKNVWFIPKKIYNSYYESD